MLFSIIVARNLAYALLLVVQILLSINICLLDGDTYSSFSAKTLIWSTGFKHLEEMHLNMSKC